MNKNYQNLPIPTYSNEAECLLLASVMLGLKDAIHCISELQKSVEGLGAKEGAGYYLEYLEKVKNHYQKYLECKYPEMRSEQ